MYFIGIDGGGTKTSFELYDKKLICIGRVIKPTCHILQVHPNDAIKILHDGVQELLQTIPSEEKVIISAGLAGYGEDEKIRKKIEKICEKAFHSLKYYIYNDVDIALEGALNGEDGILIVAGTGSIALSKLGENYQRAGGWGYMLGDEGSAYWIAKEIFRHYTFQIDGREKRTQLISLVKKELMLEKDYDLISYFTNVIKNDRKNIAAHAKLLEQLLEIGDPVGIKIINELSNHLSLLINTLGRNFSENVKASYMGGVFNLGSPLFDRLDQKLSKNIHLVEPKYTPEKGAVLKAIKIC